MHATTLNGVDHNCEQIIKFNKSSTLFYNTHCLDLSSIILKSLSEP